MKEHGIKILYGILAFGILISIFHVLTDQGGSGLGNVIDTITITSLILFISSVIYLLSSFKQNIKKIGLWIILILSFPLGIMSMTNIIKEFSLKLTKTTTPSEYIYNVKVDKFKYENDKIKLEKLIDSLIKIKIIEKPAELALRYFNGETYNDTIERGRAIDLPLKKEYKAFFIDTLFYSENKKDIVAGLLIYKEFNEYKDYPNGGIEYNGRGFLFDKNAVKPFKILSCICGYNTYASCSYRLRYYYFKKIGTYENEYNMNDKRFLNRKQTE